MSCETKAEERDYKPEPERLETDEERRYQRGFVQAITNDLRARIHLARRPAPVISRARQPRGCFSVRRKGG